MPVISKFQTINTPCKEFVHPWTDSCAEASAGLLLHAVFASFRIYVAAYLLTMVMKGKKPSKKDIKYTILGIIQSTAFLTCQAFGYSLTLCTIRKVMGNYNFLTVSFIPSFITNVISILVERPSRRGLLSLYVVNVASETLFRMGVDRKWFKPIPYGEVAMFACSSALLLYFYRGTHNEKDSIYSLLRFFVGPCEESGFVKIKEENTCVRSSQNYFGRCMNYIKQLSSHPSCPHSNSCVYYTLQSSAKLFSIGCGLQLCLKFLLQVNKLTKRPKVVFYNMFQTDTLKIGAFFAGFGGVFRTMSCLLRRFRNHDSELNAIPAGFAAGLSFLLFRDNTAALYAMWKSVLILYEMGVDKGALPPFPGGTVFFYALATAILFHAALVEPHTIRPSYWRFLVNVSGNRINTMDRQCLEVFGLESQKSLDIAQRRLLRK